MSFKRRAGNGDGGPGRRCDLNELLSTTEQESPRRRDELKKFWTWIQKAFQNTIRKRWAAQLFVPLKAYSGRLVFSLVLGLLTVVVMGMSTGHTAWHRPWPAPA